MCVMIRRKYTLVGAHARIRIRILSDTVAPRVSPRFFCFLRSLAHSTHSNHHVLACCRRDDRPLLPGRNLVRGRILGAVNVAAVGVRANTQAHRGVRSVCGFVFVTGMAPCLVPRG